MKRLCLICVLTTTLFIFSPVCVSGFKTRAVATNPSSGTYTSGQSTTIQLVARPQTGEVAVSIRLSVTGMTITNYTPPSSGWLTVIPMCGGSQSFTSTMVCVDMGKSTAITYGESLGTITVTFGTTSSATISKITGNAYSDGSTIRDDIGTAATFTRSTSGDSDLPDTSFLEEKKYILIATGVGLLFAGIFLAYKIKEKLKSKSTTQNF